MNFKKLLLLFFLCLSIFPRVAFSRNLPIEMLYPKNAAIYIGSLSVDEFQTFFFENLILKNLPKEISKLQLSTNFREPSENKIRVSELNQKISQIQINNTLKPILSKCGTRVGAINFPSIVNFPSTFSYTNMEGSTLNIFLLHEALEALSIFDVNYSVSVGLWVLKEIRQSNDTSLFYELLNSNFWSKITDSNQTINHCDERSPAGGGFTGGGDGGDPVGIQLKVNVARLIMKNAELQPSQKRVALISLLNSSLEAHPAGLSHFFSNLQRNRSYYKFIADHLVSFAQGVNQKRYYFILSPADNMATLVIEAEVGLIYNSIMNENGFASEVVDFVPESQQFQTFLDSLIKNGVIINCHGWGIFGTCETVYY